MQKFTKIKMVLLSKYVAVFEVIFLSTQVPFFICSGCHAVITQYTNLASNVLKIIEKHVATTSLFFIKIQKDVFLNFVQLDSKMNLCKLIFLFPYFFHVPDWLSIPKMSWKCLNKLSLHTNITYKCMYWKHKNLT